MKFNKSHEAAFQDDLCAERALDAAHLMMAEGVEPRSALKQAASDAGIPYGPEMEEFVRWAETQL